MQIVPDRFEAAQPGALSAAQRRLAASQSAVLQFSGPPYEKSVLRGIDQLAAEYGDLLEVRFYGHYQGAFDFRTLEKVPRVVRLSTDCLMGASNVEVLSELRQLRMLSFGVFDLENVDLLGLLDPTMLQELAIGETRSRKLDLSRLGDFQELELLRICAQTRGIEAAGSLERLERLWLNSIPKKQRIEFVNSLPSLRELHVILGGRDDIAEVENATVEELEVVRVRGFARFPDLARFPELKSLKIEDQLRLEEIQVPPVGSKLEHLSLHNCKKLSLLHGLENLDHLKELRVSRTALDYDRLLDDLLPGSLDVVALYTGSEKRNRALRLRLDALGFREHGSP